MPHRRPMSSIGPRCAELRIDDGEAGKSWRIVYRRDSDLVLVAGVFEKKSQATKQHEIVKCRNCLATYDRAVQATKSKKEN